MTTTSIPALLEPIQARLDAATPGPWHLDRDEPGDVASVVAYAHNDGVTIGTYVADTVEEDGDAAFIANAPTDTARLLAAVKAVTEMHCETKRDFITAIDCIREECDCENECPTEELPVCRHCWNQLEQIDPYFGEEHHVSEVMWPCPTVSAVEAALRETA